VSARHSNFSHRTIYGLYAAARALDAEKFDLKLLVTLGFDVVDLVHLLGEGRMPIKFSAA
jgi:hypothetical protein